MSLNSWIRTALLRWARRLMAQVVAITGPDVPDRAAAVIHPRPDGLRHRDGGYHLVVMADGETDAVEYLGDAKRRAEELVGAPLAWQLEDEGWTGYPYGDTHREYLATLYGDDEDGA